MSRPWGPIPANLAALLVSLPSVGVTQPPLPADLAAVDPMVRERVETAWQRVREAPDESAGWFELARVYHAHEFTDLAAECYRQTVALDPADPRARYLLAIAAYELGEALTALEALDDTLDLAPEYAPAHWRQGRWLLETGDSVAAAAAFRRATEVDPEDLAGWVGIAQILIGERRPGEAIEILLRVLASDPRNGVAGQLLGTAFRAAGDEAAARRALAMATGMGAFFPDPWLEEMLQFATGVGNQLRLLNRRLERGDVDAVVVKLEELRRRHPGDLGVLNKLSEGYLLQKRPGAARAVLATAYEIDPEDFSTLMHLAQAEHQGGEPESALEWADRAVAANPGHWQAYFERANILGGMGRYSECLEALDSAMPLGANQNPDAWLMQGDVLLRVGEWSKAAATFEQACLRFPYLGAAFLGKAVAVAELGELVEAWAALEQARRLRAPAASAAAVEIHLRELENAGQ